MKIAKLTPADHDRWTELWRGYLTFYKTELPPDIYAHTWSRLMSGTEIHCLAAHANGEIVGITHYLFHPHAWSKGPACYLQDLFVDPTARGTGAGRQLIEAVAAAARTEGAERLYWMTQDTNVTARQLYDRLANNRGFIRYEYPLQ